MKSYSSREIVKIIPKVHYNILKAVISKLK